MAFQMTGESCRLPQSFDPYNGQTFIKFPYRFCMSWEKWIAGLTITYLHRILDINRELAYFSQILRSNDGHLSTSEIS